MGTWWADALSERRSSVAGMRFALSVPPFVDPTELVDLAVRAEEAGWDGFFLWDHLRFGYGRRLEIHDPWVLLGAMAVRTSRVLLGTFVTPVPRRRPQTLAKHVVTLDHLSGGRAILGVGIGDPSEADFQDFGDASTYKERAAVLDEGLLVLDGLLRGDRVDHDGEYFHVHAEMAPSPVQRPRPPIWVAARPPSQRPLRRARRWDGIAPIGPGESLSPQDIAEYVGNEVMPGWDILVPRQPGVPVSEYANAGATWLIDSTWPMDDGWFADLGERVAAGPPN